MFYRRQARKRGRQLARRLRDTIVWRTRGEIQLGDVWQVVEHPSLDGVTEICWAGYSVTIQPSKQLPAVRIFDRCRLCFKGADVWLSLWQRLRLKNAVRLWSVERAKQL